MPSPLSIPEFRSALAEQADAAVVFALRDRLFTVSDAGEVHQEPGDGLEGLALLADRLVEARVYGPSQHAAAGVYIVGNGRIVDATDAFERELEALAYMMN